MAMETVFKYSGDNGVRRAGDSHQRMLRYYRVHNLVQKQTPVTGQKQHTTTWSQK